MGLGAKFLLPLVRGSCALSKSASKSYILAVKGVGAIVGACGTSTEIEFQGPLEDGWIWGTSAGPRGAGLEVRVRRMSEEAESRGTSEVLEQAACGTGEILVEPEDENKVVLLAGSPYKSLRGWQERVWLALHCA
jgi:hypothetical protein